MTRYITVAIDEALPIAVVYRFRLRGRAGWASSNGFQRCEPPAAPLLEPLTLRIFRRDAGECSRARPAGR
jgi:hypothetical protein